MLATDSETRTVDSVTPKQHVAHLSNLLDQGAMPPVVDVPPQPTEDSTLALEAVHFLFGRHPCGRIGFFHWSPQCLGIVANGLDVFIGNLSKLPGHNLEFV